MSVRLGGFMEISGVLPITQFAYWKDLGTCDVEMDRMSKFAYPRMRIRMQKLVKLGGCEYICEYQLVEIRGCEY